MTDNTDLIHNAIRALRMIDDAERDAFFKRGEALSLLKSIKPWKGNGYNGATTWAQFCVGVLGMKRNTADQCIRVAVRFGPAAIKESLPVIPSRLVRALSIHTSSDDAESELLHKCTDVLPHKAFDIYIKEITGKPHAESCDHINVKENKREQWVKHTCCGTWEKLS